jgi:hypothetical protein
MAFLELFDETLDINSTENYDLSVELSTDGLSFCVLDTIRNKFIMLRSTQPENNNKYSPEEISEIIRKDDFLTKKYRKVNIIFPSPKFTLIPSVLFDPGRKDDYFTFNHVSPESNIILNNKLSSPDSFLVYASPLTLYDLVNEVWPGVHPYHQLKPLSEYIGSRKHSGDNYFHAHLEHDFFNILFYSKSTLKFCNSFNYRTVSDILYYIMNVFRNMDIKQDVTVFLSGQVEKNDDLFSGLALYIQNIKFAEPSGNFTFSYVFNDTDLHRYINLFNVANCV